MTGQLVWLITGCSSGIGEATVRAILAKGDKVIATSRAKNGINGTNRLSTLAHAGAAVLELDVNSSQERLMEIAEEAWKIYGHVDVVMNNAGYMDAGTTEEYNTEQLTNILQTHVFGPLNLSRAFLPLMRSRMSGTFLFAASASPYTTGPVASGYAGSKALLESIVQKMAGEVGPFGVRCCVLVFGHYRTNHLSPENCVSSGRKTIPEYEELDNLVQKILKEGHGTQIGDPVKAAGLTVDAVRGEGSCVGKELPMRLPLGPDAFAAMRGHCQELLKICDEWEDIASKTSFLEGEG
ncbi:uncharacterized protein N7483_000831 [Penicillium malachiteum]|uniref:uncharacterized protein n=1 Tax=Penicillium malachiteum TaxID=1324776 RepID=UPI002548E844|nr:uncharacterized protein N7483_000831 [Penicillium malachiteum]KAJ5735706.1 hypothetical protein N7483_000831 [Penicillium malachiteum]